MHKKHIRGIIFDLDGTLVTSDIDFVLLKKDIGCPSDQDILAFIDSLDEPEQQAALSLVMQVELEDALSCEWIPGAKEFVDALMFNNIPMAIVTRNCRVATSVKVSNHQIPIKLVLTREDATCKPDPAALNIIAKHWGFDTSEIAYVGDYIYDIEAANRARMQAWVYQYEVQQPSNLQVDMRFNCYTELDLEQLNLISAS